MCTYVRFTYYIFLIDVSITRDDLHYAFNRMFNLNELLFFKGRTFFFLTKCKHFDLIVELIKRMRILFKYNNG